VQLAGFCFNHHLIIQNSSGIFLVRSLPVAVISSLILCLCWCLETGAQKLSLVKPRGIIQPNVLQAKKVIPASFTIRFSCWLAQSVSAIALLCELGEQLNSFLTPKAH